MMPFSILPTGTDIRVLCLSYSVRGIEIHCKSPCTGDACPRCGRVSRRIHSRYERIVWDGAWQAVAVALILKVRKFFCDNPKCPRMVFSDSFPETAPPYCRRTQRLTSQLLDLGLALGGEAGSRLARKLGLDWSADTLLRVIRHTEIPPLDRVRVLGVDDFAFRRGQRYGTILVDLERHKPVDLLEDRGAANLSDWLQTHPGVEIISRDRWRPYANAATTSAPKAIQVVDRWHLRKNLTELLERLVQ
ncbi:ISL3 family transposase [Sulfidibacter corallicola]|uniref:ISL3 family transposase n=1 Tax=Sulfidibacter corallicola TaxID=2818388 RepID=A0A8A4TQX8_SULCO|nr:ISL3 family transposase [Sulfidibacter corallicola]QTD51817.1 ISL3 family transposase [Sulfidibacter corallicola]